MDYDYPTDGYPYDDPNAGDTMLGAVGDLAEKANRLHARGGPSLGEDNYTVRERAKAALKALRMKAAQAAMVSDEEADTDSDSDAESGSDAEPEPPVKPTFEELRKRHQVDLNDEKHLADLEDPGLMDHMRKARLALAAYESERARLPSSEVLRRDDTTARRALSGVVTQLKEQQMALQCVRDEVILHATNIERLISGTTPHGYPAQPDPKDRDGVLTRNMSYLMKKVSGAGEELSRIIVYLEDFERGLTLARRNYESVVDGLQRRHDGLEAAIEKVTTATAARPEKP
jgi:hypothetical protein